MSFSLKRYQSLPAYSFYHAARQAPVSVSFDEIRDIVNAATGLNYSFDDLMALGEKSVQLQRKLYLATGGQDEVFLDYLANEIPHGPSKGQRIDKADFETAREHYLRLWGWQDQG